jgi:hypothetical protein
MSVQARFEALFREHFGALVAAGASQNDAAAAAIQHASVAMQAPQGEMGTMVADKPTADSAANELTRLGESPAADQVSSRTRSTRKHAPTAIASGDTK